MNLKECCSAAGADYDDVMRRFVSEERVDRFLEMFLRDQSYNTLCQTMEAGAYQDAFCAVHTLKGICMNLSLTALLDACVALTENLRRGRPDEQTEQCFAHVQEHYLRTADAVRSHLN